MSSEKRGGKTVVSPNQVGQEPWRDWRVNDAPRRSSRHFRLVGALLRRLPLICGPISREKVQTGHEKQFSEFVTRKQKFESKPNWNWKKNGETVKVLVFAKRERPEIHASEWKSPRWLAKQTSRCSQKKSNCTSCRHAAEPHFSHTSKQKPWFRTFWSRSSRPTMSLLHSKSCRRDLNAEPRKQSQRTRARGRKAPHLFFGWQWHSFFAGLEPKQARKHIPVQVEWLLGMKWISEVKEELDLNVFWFRSEFGFQCFWQICSRHFLRSPGVALAHSRSIRWEKEFYFRFCTRFAVNSI